MQNNTQDTPSEEIQLFNTLSFTTKLTEVLSTIGNWCKIIGLISMISVGISAVKLIVNNNSEQIAIDVISGAIGYILFRAGKGIETGIKNYNQTQLQQGFRYLYRYFFISFIVYVFLIVILIIAGLLYSKM